MLKIVLNELLPRFHQCGARTCAGPILEPVLCISTTKSQPWARKKQLQHGTIEKLVSEFGTVMMLKVGWTIASKPSTYLENLTHN